MTRNLSVPPVSHWGHIAIEGLNDDDDDDTTVIEQTISELLAR